MNRRGRTVIFGAVLAVLLVSVSVCALLLGSVELSPGRIIAGLTGGDRNAEVIILSLRLPRLAAALLAGAGLAAAGLLLQTVTDNDLCAPNIIGVNSGAGFAVIVQMCLFPELWRLLPVTAFAGAFLTAMSVLSISHVGSGDISGGKSTLVLAGVAVSSILGAGISLFQLEYPDVLSSYTAFSVGGFSGVSMKQLAVPAVMIFVCFAAATVIAPKISLLSLGDETAATLGVRVGLVRVTAVMLASALCAAVVSFAGLLGFIGLIVPHIVKRLLGTSLRLSIPAAAASGSLLAVLSDLVGRTVLAPSELPAGIIMAFIGAPFFIYLLLRHRGGVRRD